MPIGIVVPAVEVSQLEERGAGHIIEAGALPKVGQLMEHRHAGGQLEGGAASVGADLVCGEAQVHAVAVGLVDCGAGSAPPAGLLDRTTGGGSPGPRRPTSRQ